VRHPARRPNQLNRLRDTWLCSLATAALLGLCGCASGDGRSSGDPVADVIGGAAVFFGEMAAWHGRTHPG